MSNLKKEWRGLTDKEVRDKGLKRKYNMSFEDLEGLLKSQKDKCGICGDSLHPYNAVVDHCHLTGQVRGALCDNCNKALGLLKDSKSVIRRALYYMTKYIDRVKGLGFKEKFKER